VFPSVRRYRDGEVLTGCVDTGPGELAFLELLGRPNAALPEPHGLASDIFHLPPPGGSDATRLDSILRVLRFLFQAAVLPTREDDTMLGRLFAVLHHRDPRKQSWTWDNWWEEVLSEHVMNTIDTFWDDDNHAPRMCNIKGHHEHLGLDPEYKRLIEAARTALHKCHKDPGPPPETWPNCHAALVYQRMLTQFDEVPFTLDVEPREYAARLYSRLLSHTEPRAPGAEAAYRASAEESRRHLASVYNLDPGEPPPAWTACQASAVYALMVTLVDFQAPILARVASHTDGAHAGAVAPTRTDVSSVALTLHGKLKEVKLLAIHSASVELEPLREEWLRCCPADFSESLAFIQRRREAILDVRRKAAATAKRRPPEAVGGKGNLQPETVARKIVLWARCVPEPKKRKQARGKPVAAKKRQP
jgi:hypothetical protein